MKENKPKNIAKKDKTPSVASNICRDCGIHFTNRKAWDIHMKEKHRVIVTEIGGKPVYENTCLECGTAWNCYSCGKDVLKDPHEGFTGAILFDSGEQSSMAGPGEPAQFYIECKECYDERTKK